MVLFLPEEHPGFYYACKYVVTILINIIWGLAFCSRGILRCPDFNEGGAGWQSPAQSH